MKHLKKNDKILIDIVQTASYMLKLTNHKHERINKIQKKSFKKQVNDTLAFLKHEVKGLKRI
jgi:hypothetical protein